MPGAPTPSQSDPPTAPPADSGTRAASYAERLARLGGTWWKQALDVQRPYRWHLRRLGLGFTLDLGCGIGRNLGHLGGQGVGVDHNADAVARCRAAGLTAFLPAEFSASEYAAPGRFDSLLCAHVLEHMPRTAAANLLAGYLPFVRPRGRVVLIVPQEAGQRTDPTHVTFFNHGELFRLAREVNLDVERTYSFPFPRPVGLAFPHNETVLLARTHRA